VLLTYLNHTCPLVPHYRGASWSFVRAGLATVDRPLLGWAGRVFLHNVAHDHVAHHFFSRCVPRAPCPFRCAALTILCLQDTLLCARPRSNASNAEPPLTGPQITSRR
jgi:hypothetical protein